MFKRITIYWLFVVFVVTIVAGLVYGVEQQNLRQSANDPQIQMAEDAAYALESGQSVDSVVPKSQVDVARSLSPFIIVYDGTKKVVASSGVLNNNYPAVPLGVLDYVAQHGENRLTWMPMSGVRIATVVVKYGGKNPGYVLVGRSLREVEKRVGNIQQFIALVWIFTLAIAFIIMFVGDMLFKKGTV